MMATWVINFVWESSNRGPMKFTSKCTKNTENESERGARNPQDHKQQPALTVTSNSNQTELVVVDLLF